MAKIVNLLLVKRPPIKVRIRENSFLARIAAFKLGSRTMALTLGRTIYLHNATRSEFMNNTGWVCHELAHVYQYRRYGIVSFLLRYAWESLRRGYFHNRLEAEARDAEKDRSLLEEVIFC